MARKYFTDEQKAEILKKIEETSIIAVSKEFGVSRVSINRWKKELAAGKEPEGKKDAAVESVAEMVEAGKEKKSRGRRKVTAAAATVEKAEVTAEKKPRAGKKAAQKKALAAETEKVIQATAEQVAAKEKKAGGLVIIQSAFGNEITPEDIRERVGEVDAVYVRVDQNRAYWVKGEETGSVELW